MKQSEFEARFAVYWKANYAGFDGTGKDYQRLIRDWKERARDNMRSTSLKLDMLRYARDCQTCPASREKKNLAQRIFDDLGIDPREIEFDEPTREFLEIPHEVA